MISARRLHHSIVAVAAVACIGLASCGSDETTDPVGDSIEPSSPDSVGEVIGTGNVGGTVVDPQPHPIDGIDIAESYPEQLIVRFTAGDPNCTAADATATANVDTVVVELRVGITEDALARSCLAGDVEHAVTVALDTGLDGREVVAADA